MTVFKTLFKIVKAYKFNIIFYTILLVTFAGLNFKTSDNNMSFIAEKPDVLIVNNDQEAELTKNLTSYIEKNSNIINIENTEEAINDALFYRDVNYIIHIPENFSKDFLSGLNPEIEVKSTGDYQSALSELMLSRYIEVANMYVQSINNEEELISKINETLSKETEIEITSKLDTDNLSKASCYYNFLNYTIISGCVYVICLVLASFKEEKIRKRTMISSVDYKKHNIKLLIGNGVLAVIFWAFYVILSFILIGKVMFSYQGLILIINSLVFSICALTIAFLVGNLVRNKNAINGIIIVIGLGTSFLCGAFVPVDYLPSSVLSIAHILPSYWYIQTNELVKTLEVINFMTLKPIIINMAVILGFSILFTIVTNVVSRRKFR